MRVSQPYGKRYEEDEETIEPTLRYFIACEGEATEYQYFEGIIEFRNEIGIHPLIEIIPIEHDPNTGNNPVNILTEAIKAKEQAPNFLKGDKLCIIADRDKQSFKSNQYEKLLEAEKNGEILFCITNPCFEFWLLLHYTHCKELSEEELFQNKKTGDRTFANLKLKEALGGSYSKSNIKFEEQFKDKIRTAIENSKMYATTSIELKTKVGTTLGLLIESMLE